MRRCVAQALSRAPSACQWECPWTVEWSRRWADDASQGGSTPPAADGGAAEAPSGGGGRTRRPKFMKRSQLRKALGTYADRLVPTLRALPPAEVPPIYDLASIVRAYNPQPDAAGPLGDFSSGRRPWPELPLPPVPSPRDDSPDAPQVGSPVPPDTEPWPGAPRLLNWRTRIILQNGLDQRHPLSNKVEVTFRLRDVAAAVGLKPVGVAWIRALCGPRYTPGNDILRLVSQRYYTREDNRRDLLRIIYDLLEEGAREQGGLDPSAPGAAYVTAILEARKQAAAHMMSDDKLQAVPS